MKKLMILGGSRYVIPVIKAAHDLDLYVITCDYLPDNIAHKFSDEYCNVSVIDKNAVLEAAGRLGIDGVISFACDPGVVTAAYVAEKMGLPFQGSYQSTRILQDKGLFRKFLEDHGFHSPRAKRYTNKQSPYLDLDYFTWPVIVKPVDSAGSKGVTKVDTPEGLDRAMDTAIDCSHNGAFIIEEFLTFEGYHSSADLFTVDGNLQFVSYSDHLFDQDAENPYAPAYIIFPSSMKQQYQEELTSETQRLMTLLNMDTGIYNIETCAANNGKPYLMEVSPRGAGNRIAELQRMAYGVDLIENEIRKAVGLPLSEIKQSDCGGVWCEMVVHARPDQRGILKNIYVDEDIAEKYLKLTDFSVKPGDIVRPFTGANLSLGDIFLHCETRAELDEVLSREREWLHIETDDIAFSAK